MPSLLLHPDDWQWRPDDLGDFAASLADLGFVEASHEPGDPRAHQVGARFLQLITFLGCSPQIALRPVDANPGQEICCIHFRDFANAVFLTSAPLPQARCRNCRSPVEIVMPNPFAVPIRCERCAEFLEPDMIDWRRGGGLGRFFVEVKNVFPHEAVPSEQLLNELAEYSGCNWAYFYVNKQSCTR